MLYCVYLLQSKKNRSLYIGCTSNLQKRLSWHNSGFSYHTKKYAPWRLVYFEAYSSKIDAYNREKSLKLHAQGLRRLKERLRNSFTH
ncbi:MAG: GIY-YIG nuclease family protein [Candidatus Sungbacteria bacterium]|nr:GIY-YIG nuclease family protein [Candidatus Sungbacteria bacterium]